LLLGLEEAEEKEEEAIYKLSLFLLFLSFGG
jgi:hypothetical protein